MSVTGNNIKKIRSLKKLSQSQFAELFGLSRASIGSYEEGRAEPKIDKIIEIANYFSINLETLLKKELSVNEISGFKLSDDKMFAGNGNNLIENKQESDIFIPYITHTSTKSFISGLLYNKLWKGRKISLPPSINLTTSIAFEHNDNTMSTNVDGIAMSDIVFAENIDIDKVFDGYIYLVIIKDHILLRKVFIEGDLLTLKAINVNFQPIIINKNDVLGFYKINAILKTTINHFIEQ